MQSTPDSSSSRSPSSSEGRSRSLEKHWTADRLQPVLRAALLLLEDGEWHDYDHTVRALTRAVPPGVAIRRTEKQRASTARKNGWKTVDERKIQRDERRLIEIGAGQMARQVLSNRKRFEIDPRAVRGERARRPGEQKRVRLLLTERVRELLDQLHAE